MRGSENLGVHTLRRAERGDLWFSGPGHGVHWPGAGAYEEDGQDCERNGVHPSDPHSGALVAKWSP